ncbi:unnamed protein product [Echinostoma caproni]|uniref:Ovule protein n=1 Tax=Echinostoma caproni TaxID=27848 RepID=A0A183AIB8_9TREM|nr:unnamed protein product [Echinostoma caproni]
MYHLVQCVSICQCPHSPPQSIPVQRVVYHIIHLSRNVAPIPHPYANRLVTAKYSRSSDLIQPELFRVAAFLVVKDG